MSYAVAVLVLLWCVWFSNRYAWWGGEIDLSRPRVLMYHMVSAAVPGAKFNGLRVSPDAFEQQVKYLHEQGWHFVTMSELLSDACRGREKLVALTFDDGFADNYFNAFPILQKYGAKATLYLVVDRHERDWSVSKKKHHNSGELKNEPKLTDEQVKEMLVSGVFELGGHTLTHANLALLAPEDKFKEIHRGKIQLEEQFSVQLSSFAYPFGIYDEKNDVELVKRAGFDSAVTTIEGLPESCFAQPYQLERVKVSGKDSFFAFKIKMQRGKRGWKK